MPKKTHQERLFGAACVYVTLERSGLTADKNELYLSTLEDLEVSPDEVERYLSDERANVESALDNRAVRKG